ncbi:hypothetical protein PIROE2DRAFT_57967 [Piromyces sp. E2]|nr:hypothetical protein PIROE2DRAFT_57967 [Piromyces sp. E2]|eukprot:OUM68652.1 hypothetical protein PIROE2DRAFT_57967 [Piromyces sp. E2]
MACGCSEYRAVELLLNADANPFIRNYSGYRPIDYSKTQEITDLLIDKMKLRAIQQQGNESLYQLIEEKQIALHKNNLLESAAGINDKAGGESFLDQIQYLQDENEQAAATISYLKMRIQVLESTALQQEEYSRKNLANLTKQHTEQLQVILKRNEETEKAFLAYQKSHSDELAELNRLRTEVMTLKSKNKFSNESSEEEQLQNTIEDLQKRLTEISAEKLALEERVKLAEKLKSMVEEENEQLREDIQKIQSSMKTEMINKISSERAAKDEQDEDSGAVIFVQDESGNKQIKAATPKKLVERLTDYSSYDNQFLQAFMLTFRCFMTTNELLELIMNQYTKKVKEVNSNNQSPLYFRIVNTMKFWIDNYWDDFENSKELYDKLVSFIENFDDVSKVTLKAIIKRKVVHWLVSEIVLQENLKLRVNTLERILLFTQSLLKLNNFNGVKEVSAALQSSSIYRLKKTKKAMASKFLKLYDSILKLVSNELNFKNLRTKIHSADPPLIPFPGIYQSDLVFLDSWGKNILDGGLINFIKYQKMASYILEFNILLKLKNVKTLK